MTEPPPVFFGTAPAKEVFEKARAGCDIATEHLFQAAQDYLRIAARNAIDSDLQHQVGESDLVQETLLAANRGFANFEGQSEQQFIAWLRRIFVNNLLNQYRAFRDTSKRDCSKEQSIDGGNVPKELIATTEDETPSHQAIANEEHQLLESALETLTKEHRQVIELRHREHLTFAQIGERLDRSADAARMLWYRAFQQLSSVVERLASTKNSHRPKHDRPK